VGGAVLSALSGLEEVQFCTDRGVACLDNRTRRFGQPFNDVFIPRGSGVAARDGQWCCAALR
jgi:hypothetical protein